jgi:hypothetical protein
MTVVLAIHPEQGTWLALDNKDLASLLISLERDLGPDGTNAGGGVEVRNNTRPNDIPALVKGSAELVKLAYGGTIEVAEDIDEIETLGFVDGVLADVTASALSSLAPVVAPAAAIAGVAQINASELATALQFSNTGDSLEWATVRGHTYLWSGATYTPVMLVEPDQTLELSYTNLNVPVNTLGNLGTITGESAAFGTTEGYNFPLRNQCGGGANYCLGRGTLLSSGATICADYFLSNGQYEAAPDLSSCGASPATLPSSCFSSTTTPPTTSTSSASTLPKEALSGTYTTGPISDLLGGASGGLAPYQALDITISSEIGNSLQGSFVYYGNGLLRATNAGSISGRSNGSSISLMGAGPGFTFSLSATTSESIGSISISGTLTSGGTSTQIQMFTKP